MNEATKLNRKLRKRLDAKVERAARKSDRLEQMTGGVLVDRGEVGMLRSMLPLFVAMVKEQGRVRVSKATLDGLNEQDRVVRKDLGDAVMLTFASGPAPEEGSNEG